MSEIEFTEALRELRGEYTSPSEAADVCARLFEELWTENKRLREEMRRYADATAQNAFLTQNSRGWAV